MKVLIDGNILLDVLERREPFYKDSSLVWKLCETGQTDGCISALTFADLVYIMRKELDPVRIKDVLTRLSMIFSVEGLLPWDLLKAAELEWKDYEDAIQSVTASRISADGIITRNVKDYKDSIVQAMTPEEFLMEI